MESVQRPDRDGTEPGRPRRQPAEVRGREFVPPASSGYPFGSATTPRPVGSNSRSSERILLRKRQNHRLAFTGCVSRMADGRAEKESASSGSTERDCHRSAVDRSLLTVMDAQS